MCPDLDFDSDESIDDGLIELLSTIKTEQDETPGIKNCKYLSRRTELSSTLLCIGDIAEKYNLPEEIVLDAVREEKLVPDAFIPLFTEKEAEPFAEAFHRSVSPMILDFSSEIAHMHLTHSYKPLLLMAMLKEPSDSGETTISNIVDFYLAYYSSRRHKGLAVEKPDSTFVKFPNDRQAAKRTIIRFPLKIYRDKGFINYSPRTGIAKFNPEIWQYIVATGKEQIISLCDKILERYYNTYIDATQLTII